MKNLTKSIRSDLGFSPTNCSNVSLAENDLVETKTSEINMYISLLTSLPSMLLALFIGPWSDKNGRKPLMILPFLGNLILFSKE